MSAYFFDSSALVKRYVTETGSAWVQQIAAPQANHRLIIARVTWVEVISALARRQREGSLSINDLTKALRAFRYDLDTQYQVIEIDSTLAEAAGQLVRSHPLRAYDAVQLAAAKRIQSVFGPTSLAALIFVSADKNLNVIAQVEGLATDNPNDYP